MSIDTFLPPELAGTSLAEPLAALDGLYAEADAACAAFQAAARSRSSAEGGFPFGCPSGCGSCCERFVPDILPVEADYAALWILRNRPELSAVEPRSEAPCPYYDEADPGAHCRIYGGRPLICRLFGYSAMADKAGALEYSLCWKMPGAAAPNRNGEDLRSWRGSAIAQVFGANPPLMADFGLRLQGLAAAAPERALLGDAIRESLDRLRFLLRLAASGSDGNDNDGGNNNDGGKAA